MIYAFKLIDIYLGDSFQDSCIFIGITDSGSFVYQQF